MPQSEPSSRIPRIVHFVYGLAPQVEPFHLVHYLALESCRRIVRPERILFHYRNEPYGSWWELARPHLELVRVGEVGEMIGATYDERLVPERYRYAHHADFVRLDALIAHGGIYADVDTLFLRPFPEALLEKPFVIGRESSFPDELTGEPRPSLCNALMAAEPGSPFARAWREEMATSLNGTWNNHSGFLAAELAHRLPAEVHVEPAETFFRFGASPEGIEALFRGCERELVGTVSLHLWQHLWWEADRRDFSDVHARLLTSRRIRSEETTYNVLARDLIPVREREREAALLGRVRYAAIHLPDGYGIAGRRMMQALDEVGVDLTYEPATWLSLAGYDDPVLATAADDRELGPLLGPEGPFDTVVGHLTPENFPSLRERFPDATFVAHTVWETDRLPGHWPVLLELADLLVVPGRWNAETIRAGGVRTPLAVVPHVAPVPRRRRSPVWDAIGDDVFVFYTIVTWTPRKAVRKTIRAYLEAFRRNDPVLLVVKTTHLDYTTHRPRDPGLAGPGTTAWSVAQILKEYRDPPPLKLVTRDLDTTEIEALHTRGDCFVSLCHAEGWGIPSFDAAAYGNPVVMTGYGGQLEYLDPDAALLVDFELVPVEYSPEQASFTPDQRWAEPSVEHGAELLNRVLEDREAARERAAELARRILVRYRPEAVAEEFVRAVAGVRADGGHEAASAVSGAR